MPAIATALAIALIWVAWPSSAYAFQTNCTLPTTDDHYLSGPNVRGTLGIVWSSLGTIAACTYGVLHLNVPQQRNGRRPGGLDNLRWYWNSLRPSLDWTVITIMFPELYTAIAYDDLTRAHTTTKKLSDLPQDESLMPDGGYSLTHGFFANMGGFAIRYKEASSEGSTTSLVHLNGDSLLALLEGENRRLIKSPLLSQADIEDRSKSNLFAKTVVVLQVLYYCGSCLLRLVHRLPVTPLEIGTFGFAVCSVISFFFLFPKPRSVNTTTVIADFDRDMPDCIQELHAKECRKYPALVNNSGIHPNYKDYTVPGLAALLGAVHAAGWKFDFPSVADAWLWRSCAIVSAVSLPILWAFAVCFLDEHKRPVIPLRQCPESECIEKSRVDDEEAGDARIVRKMTALAAESEHVCTRPPLYVNIFLFVCLALYCISRIVLMVQMVRCLFFLTPDAFQATWAASLPHFG